MKITLERGPFLKTLGHVQSVVERRNTIPILSNVLIKADNGKVHLTSTDLDIQIDEIMDGRVDENGEVTVLASTLYDIVRKLVDGDVRLEAKDSRMTVSAGRSRFSLPTLPSEDFPKLAAGDLPYAFEVDAKTLENALDNTRYAMSTDDTRYYLNGIFLHVSEEGMRTVATDGHRLARNAVEGVDMPKGMPNVIVPKKAVVEVSKLLGEYDGNIDVRLSNGKISFEFGAVKLVSKLVDGTYPDYARVIPTTNETVIKTDAKLLTSALDRVSTVAAEKTRAVKFETAGGVITVTVTSPENGVASDEIACESNGDISMGFNVKYLLDALGHVTGDQVEIHVGEASQPAIILDPSRPKDLMILMPMRI